MTNQTKKEVIHPKGTICLRCGESKGNSAGCSAWGKYWQRHFFNSKPLKVSEVEIKIINQ